jgi:hypothetical protein
MLARTILACLAVVFLTLAGVRVARDGGRLGPAARTWLLIGVMFGGVSVWLWWSQP